MSTTKRITMPRRTQEFDIPAPQSSVKKPQSRVSRIAQPVRKSSKLSGLGQFGENGRSRSVERGLNVPPVGGPSTATKKSLNPRSSSATPQLRTPLRNMGHSVLNAENIPPFSIPSTIERERCPVDARQVFDYLAQANVPDLPKEFIERANIKAMSMKQFLIIIAHLLRQIGGSRYKIGANFIDDIMKAITELQCPFTVNKSMLKTPSAPHSIHQVVTMLSWLIQLAAPPALSSEWAPNYDHAAEFPSPDYTQFFFQSAIESFHLWNLKREEEFGAQVEAMVDRLVADKTGGLSQEQVRVRTEEIWKQLEAIDADRSQGKTREQSFDGVQREVLENQRLVKQLSEETKRLSKQYERLEQEYYQRQDQYYDCENAIQKVKEQLANQQMTTKERDDLQTLIAHSRNLIAAKRNAIACLDEESSDHQITLSRLIKQKINLASELNSKLYNFSNAVKPDIQFTPNEISLTSGNYPELEQTLLALEQELTDVFRQYRDLYLRLSQQKVHLEQQVSDVQLKISPLESKIAKQTEWLQQLQQQRETIARELVALAERVNERETSQQRAKKLDLSMEQVRKELESKLKAIEKLTHDKQQLMEEGLERCRQALDERQRKLTILRQHVESCETIMKELMDVCFRDTERQNISD
ncbi:trichohyalin [Anopheles funestus]|uniref:trichohyalin n=1 Tax=Anopheles funestus TaxID=62324 RepID=UPI0020C6F285|nr:trichohyalin [Anopheles funestus]